MAEEFNDCECVWSHELAMRRLLNLIRQGQTYCTDTECIDLATPNPRNVESENFTMMAMFFLFAVILYFIRPSSFMTSLNKPEQHQQPKGGQDPDSGAPPPAVN